MILKLRIFLQQALVKNKLLLPTLSVVFPLMASPPSEDDDFDDEDEDDEVEEGTEASRPCAVASQVKYSTRNFIYRYFKLINNKSGWGLVPGRMEGLRASESSARVSLATL